MFLYTFLGRCVEFFIGIGLALIVIRLDDSDRKTPLFTILGIISMIGAIAIFVILPLEGREFGLFHPLGIFTNNMVLPIGIAVFYFGLIKEKSIISSFLSTKTMQLLGKSSYIFYLLHIGVVANFTKKWTWYIIENFSTGCMNTVWIGSQNMSMIRYCLLA